ncbi:MAG: chloride channel protein, partial [Dongiaceae bacterium]
MNQMPEKTAHSRFLKGFSRRFPRRWRIFSYWRRKLIFILGAALIGLVSAGFALGADQAQAVFQTLRALSPTAAFMLSCIGFVIAAIATGRFFPSARGSGIPQVIAARRYPDPAARRRLIGAGATGWKIALTLFGLLCGASIGREGPTVQVGACIMFLLGNYAGLRRPQGLVLAGAAAGIAAAFNTPLAGIMFAIEEMARSYERRLSGLIIAAVVVAGAVSVSLLGNYKYFGSTSIDTAFTSAMIYAVICGICCGVAGSLFSFLLLAIGRLYRSLAQRKWVIYAFPAICGLVVAITGALTHGYANGTGYEQTKLALESGHALPLWYGLLKLASTVASSA